MNQGVEATPRIPWTEVELRLLPGQIDLAVQLLNQRGATGIVEEGRGDEVILRTAFPADDTVGNKVSEVKKALDRFAEELNWRPAEFVMRPLRDVDWSEEVKKHFQPFCVGKTLWVGPSWLRKSCPGNRLPVVVNPGLAFGTGLHPTTRMCLQAMDERLQPGESLWDLGCGSGILSVAACRLGARPVRASDVDPQAIDATRDNLRRNGLERAVEILLQEGAQHGEKGAWNVVVSNVHLEYIGTEGALVHQALRDGGRWILSGFLAEHGDSVEDALLKAGFENRSLWTVEEWGAGVAIKSRD